MGDFILSAGTISEPYKTLGIVCTIIVKEEAGCSGGIPRKQAIQDAIDDLSKQSAEMGGNGLIHFSFQITEGISSVGGCAGSKSGIRIIAIGTSIVVGQ
jgi:hypothetical protein